MFFSLNRLEPPHQNRDRFCKGDGAPTLRAATSASPYGATYNGDRKCDRDRSLFHFLHTGCCSQYHGTSRPTTRRAARHRLLSKLTAPSATPEVRRVGIKTTRRVPTSPRKHFVTGAPRYKCDQSLGEPLMTRNRNIEVASQRETASETRDVV